MAREHRKEKEPKGERAKRAGAPATAAAAPAASDGVAGEELDENEDIQKAFVHSYCALDYARMVDMVSLRLHRMRRRLKDAVQKRCGASGSHGTRDRASGRCEMLQYCAPQNPVCTRCSQGMRAPGDASEPCITTACTSESSVRPTSCLRVPDGVPEPSVR